MVDILSWNPYAPFFRHGNIDQKLEIYKIFQRYLFWPEILYPPPIYQSRPEIRNLYIFCLFFYQKSQIALNKEIL